MRGGRGASGAPSDGAATGFALVVRVRPGVRACTWVLAVSAPARFTGLRLGEVTTTGPIGLGLLAAGAAVCAKPGCAVTLNSSANRPSGVSDEHARANIGAERRSRMEFDTMIVPTANA